MPSNTRILGIDCGTAITGWSIMDIPTTKVSSVKPKLVSCGIIETHKFTPEADRLTDLGRSFRELLTEFNPAELAIEDIFFFRNATTVIKVSQARGVVLYEANIAGLSIHSYTPLQIKQQLTGYGRADKKQVMFIVNKLFSSQEKITQDDAADAVAVAYCHYLSNT